MKLRQLSVTTDSTLDSWKSNATQSLKSECNMNINHYLPYSTAHTLNERTGKRTSYQKFHLDIYTLEFNHCTDSIIHSCTLSWSL